MGALVERLVEKKAQAGAGFLQPVLDLPGKGQDDSHSGFIGFGGDLKNYGRPGRRERSGRQEEGR
jgi:hypothetical protein